MSILQSTKQCHGACMCCKAQCSAARHQAQVAQNSAARHKCVAKHKTVLQGMNVLQSMHVLQSTKQCCKAQMCCKAQNSAARHKGASQQTAISPDSSRFQDCCDLNSHDSQFRSFNLGLYALVLCSSIHGLVQKAYK